MNTRWNALEQLPDRCRRLIDLLYFDITEAPDILNIRNRECRKRASARHEECLEKLKVTGLNAGAISHGARRSSEMLRCRPGATGSNHRPGASSNPLDSIWLKVRPLYAGQPKSLESAQSLSLAQAARRLAVHAANDRLLIEAWHMMGRSLSANEEFEKAIPFYRQVIRRLEQIGDFQQSSRLRLALVGVLLNADHYADAFEAARVAEKWFTENHDEVGFARLCHNIANIYHRTDDHAKAYEYYLKAYELFQKLGDQRDIAYSRFNLGNVLGNLDQFEKSDEMYEKAIDLSHELGMTDLWTQANYNRAYLYYLRAVQRALRGVLRLRQSSKMPEACTPRSAI
jgi:tetratricopeptide (TPR) repeat protein